MEKDGDGYIYLYLDFNDKLTPSLFDSELFLRIANLHKRNPLVQVNDLIFKGSFEESVGTNLFFEEVEDVPAKTNIFEKSTPISLRHVLSQTKILKLTQMKLPSTVWSNKQNTETTEIDLKKDYQMVLDKLEQGALNLEDIKKHKHEGSSSRETAAENGIDSHQSNVQTQAKTVENPHAAINLQSSSKALEEKYERLKRLARRPVKRMMSPELVEECEPQYKKAFELHNLEKQILQTSDAFPPDMEPILKHNLQGGVDIDRCVLQGLIPNSDGPKGHLTEEECNKVLNLDNFGNLSIPARYLVLKESVNKIEEVIQNASAEELGQKDECGRTAVDIHEILKALLTVLERRVYPTSEISRKTKEKIKMSSGNLDNEDYVKYRYNPSEDLVLDDDLDEEFVERIDQRSVETECNDSDESEDSLDSSEFSYDDNVGHHFLSHR